MPHELSGATLKLQRAYYHAHVLHEAIQRVREGYPREVVAEVEAKPGGHTIAYTVQFDEPLPGGWSPLIGDILHNIRSALDHLIWELMRRRLGREPDPGARATFPIFANKRKFWAKGKNGEWTSRSGAATLRLIPADARQLIVDVQPYKSGHRQHPLWQLAQLSNDDKHKTLHYVHTAMVSTNLIVTALDNAAIGDFQPSSGAASIGSPYLMGKVTIQTIDPTRETNYTVEPQFAFAETFAEGGPASGLPVSESLKEIFEYVGYTVFRERFWPYFGIDPMEEARVIRDYAKAYPH